MCKLWHWVMSALMCALWAAAVPTPASAAVCVTGMPEGRTYHKAVTDGTDIYVVGGDYKAAADGTLIPQDTLFKYDVTADTWSTLTPMGSPRGRLAAVYHNGYIYAIGGLGGATNTVERYEIATDTWTDLPALNIASTVQGNPVAVAGSDGLIYLYGGIQGSTTAAAMRFDPANTAAGWTTVDSMNVARREFDGCADASGTPYAVGGRDGGAIASTEAYDIGADQWNSLASLSQGKIGTAAACDASGGVYAIGGVPTDSPADKGKRVELYDPSGNSWTTIAPLNEDRLYGSAVYLDGLVYVLGGGDINSNLPRATVEIYDPADTGAGWTLSSAVCVPPPVADAGPDQSVSEDTVVTLDGSASTGDDLTYAWQQVAGDPVVLSGDDTDMPTFTAPLVPAGGTVLTFELVVSNDGGTSDPDTVDITIVNVNNPPVADAGDDATYPEGTAIELSGTMSYDEDSEPVTCIWGQPAGTLVVLTPVTADNCVVSFTAPALVPVGGETLTFSLVVDDGLDLSDNTDTVDILITHINQPPAANAGGAGPLTRDEFSNVVLDGSGSSDPENDPLTYAWNQISGPPVVINNANAAVADFDAPAVLPGGELFVFELTVNDGEYDDVDQTQIMVRNINDAPNCADAVADPDGLWPPNHKMKDVVIGNLADPDADNITLTITGVTQDEPVDGDEDGNTSPDAVIQASGALIRAERAGDQDGRVYAINFLADDGLESCTGTVQVTVPKSRKSTAVDSGQLYDSTQP